MKNRGNTCDKSWDGCFVTTLRKRKKQRRKYLGLLIALCMNGETALSRRLIAPSGCELPLNCAECASNPSFLNHELDPRPWCWRSWTHNSNHRSRSISQCRGQGHSGFLSRRRQIDRVCQHVGCTLCLLSQPIPCQYFARGLTTSLVPMMRDRKVVNIASRHTTLHVNSEFSVGP